MAIAGDGMAVPAHVEEELLVAACRAQATDRFRWLPEMREHLDQLHERAQSALAAWPGGGDGGPEEVRQFVSDYPRAVRAWEAAALVVAGMDEIRANPASDRRQDILQAIRTVEGDAGRIWHDETVRIVQRDLARRGMLLGAEAWLAAARADLTPREEVAEATASVPPPPPAVRAADEASTPPRVATPPPGTREARRPRPNPERIALKPRLPRARELRDALADRTLEVCQTYLPAGKLSGGRWSIGDVEGAPGKSMWVTLSGPWRGHWKDGATDESGDLLDVIARSRGLDMGAAMEEARAFLGGSFAVAATSRQPAAPGRDDAAREMVALAKRMRRSAQSNWTASRTIRPQDTTHPAARYLRRRGLDPAAAQGLRWRENARTQVDGEWRSFPALVARIETHDGEFEGVHRIFLDEEGGKAALDGGAKRSLGPQTKGGVWFGNRAAARVVMTEGIEDAVAAIQALPEGALENLAVVATAGGARMHRVELPPGARELVVLQDNNEPGERAWKDVAAHYRETAVAVTRIVTEKDVNDDLLTDPAGLRRRLGPLAVAPGAPQEAAGVTAEKTEKAGVTADEIRHLEGRVDVWRAMAAIGGWDAADIDRMSADMERVEAALADWPSGGGAEESRQRLEAFSADAGRAHDAMRLAGSVTADVIALMNDRGMIQPGEMGPGEDPMPWQTWTGKAGLVRAAVDELRAAEGTLWEEAVYAELGRQVMGSPEAVRRTEGVSSEKARARYFLRIADREIAAALKQAPRETRTGPRFRRGGPGLG